MALVGMGSNINPELYLSAASTAIRNEFKKVVFSSVYRSEAVGMDGDDFLNACFLLQDAPSFEALQVWLKGLEDEHGRDRSKGSWKPRTLDLDILMYANQSMDDDLARYAHVYVPASELVALQANGEMDLNAVEKVNLVL